VFLESVFHLFQDVFHAISSGFGIISNRINVNAREVATAGYSDSGLILLVSHDVEN
jgi:hypothetical protein